VIGTARDLCICIYSPRRNRRSASAAPADKIADQHQKKLSWRFNPMEASTANTRLLTNTTGSKRVSQRSLVSSFKLRYVVL